MGISTRSTAARPLTESGLEHVTAGVRTQLAEVEDRIAAQAAAFDPAIEGYVTFALGSRGKRLRPLLALLSGGATGTITSKHVDLAVVVELVHVATLVHDDIIDEAERRRSQPTVNARWGNALSVLLGDALFAHALDLSTNFDNPAVSRAVARSAREVCSGEILQTQRRFDLHLAIDEYLRIIRMKTAALFGCACEIGALLNDAPAPIGAALKQFGLRLGTAYQIYDDCVDLAGDEGKTGKTLGTDLRKGKLTLPILIMLRSTPEAERARCSELILKGDTDEITRRLRSGAGGGPLRESIATARVLVAEAEAQLEALPANSETDSLLALANSIRELLAQLRG